MTMGHEAVGIEQFQQNEGSVHNDQRRRIDPRLREREMPSQDLPVAPAEKLARAISTIRSSMGEMAQRITAGWLPNVYCISGANCSAQT